MPDFGIYRRGGPRAGGRRTGAEFPDLIRDGLALFEWTERILSRRHVFSFLENPCVFPYIERAVPGWRKW